MTRKKKDIYNPDPLLQYSNTPILQYSNTPLLHRSMFESVKSMESAVQTPAFSLNRERVNDYVRNLRPV